MKKLLLFIVLLCSISLSFSQEKQLSEEEKAKRERNIQAGNPFKEFGYTPKIATLSKGKYLEFHDLDSIVKIGSFTFHVKEKAINGYSQEEIKYSEATLRPEIVSRWFSPDPLSEEFPSWSPYNFTMNNPIRFIDPDGRAPMDIILKGANNSSVTIVTDLIDVSVDASSFVGDLGGNYSFQGDDILVAGLDIVGIVDPTGVADIASASIEAKNGNWGGAILSGLGVIPYVGDLGKVGKIGKHVKTINKAIDGAKSSKKTDFVVTADGISIPKSQSQMRKGFDDAGFPSKSATQTSETGTIHTVPTKNGKVDVRTMDGSSRHPKRAVVTHPGTNSPKTPSGRATTNKKDNHIEQHN